MSWTFDAACFWNFDEGTTHTISIAGVRYFALISEPRYVFVAAPASANDGESLRAQEDVKLVDCIALARKVEAAPAFSRETSRIELRRWSHDRGHGYLFNVPINRMLVDDMLDALIVAGGDVQEAPIRVYVNRDIVSAAVFVIGDAIAMVMGLNPGTILSPRDWPFVDATEDE